MQRRSGPCAVPCFRGWTCRLRRLFRPGPENSGELSGTLQRDLQALGFAVVELGEYLDTHPGDARAAELFRSYSGLYAQAATAWEAENGPIVQRSAVGESGYDWLRGPWPWQYAANDGEG